MEIIYDFQDTSRNKAESNRLWLKRESRKDIAINCRIGEGTVSNIVYDWRRNLSNGNADPLRE